MACGRGQGGLQGDALLPPRQAAGFRNLTAAMRKAQPCCSGLIGASGWGILNVRYLWESQEGTSCLAVGTKGQT